MPAESPGKLVVSARVRGTERVCALTDGCRSFMYAILTTYKKEGDVPKTFLTWRCSKCGKSEVAGRTLATLDDAALDRLADAPMD